MTPPTASFAAASVGDRPTMTGDEGTGSVALPPPNIPEYELGEVLGQGGMGIVHRAKHRGLGRPAAVKLVLTGGDGSRGRVRFLAEAEAMASVDHPNVVRVYDSGTADGRPYLAMELLPGGSLADRLKAGRLTAMETAKLVEAIARGVQAAHDQGIVHRDLKPGNVLLTDDGQPKVTDFGLAKRGGTQDLTRTGAVMGTPTYMAPEQARGDGKLAGPAADVWALGVILFECLTGRPPFQADDAVGLLLKVATLDAPPARSVDAAVPRDLELVAGKCLRRDPRERYPTAAAFADELGRFARGEPVEVRPMGPRERLTHWRRRNRLLYNAIATILITLQVGFFVSLSFARRANVAANNAQWAEQRAKEEAMAARTAEKKAKDAEAEQRTLREQQKSAAVRALLTTARLEVAADNPAAALRPAAEAHALDPAAGGDTLADAVLARMPRLGLVGRHAGSVACLAVSPDAERVATAGLDGLVKLWHPATGSVAALPALPGPVYAVAFNVAGTELLAAGGTLLQSGYVQRFALPAGTPVGPPTLSKQTPIVAGYGSAGPATAEVGTVGGFLRSLTGKSAFVFRTAAGSWDRTPWLAPEPRSIARGFDAAAGLVLDRSHNSVRVVRLDGGKSVGRFLYPGNPAVAVLTGDGRYAVVCPPSWLDVPARLWDLQAGTEVKVPLNIRETPLDAVVTPGRHLLVAFADGSVLRYAADGRPVGGVGRPIPGGAEAVGGGVTFSPDGLLLAAVGKDGAVRVAATNSRELIGPPLPHTAAVTGVAFLSHNRRLAVAAADGTVRVWEFGATERALFSAQFNIPPEDVRFLPDGRFAVTGNGVQCRQFTDRGPQGGYVTVGPSRTDYTGTVITPDGERILHKTHNRLVRVLDADGKELGTLPTGNPFVTDLQLSPDGSLAVTADVTSLTPPASFAGVIRVWDVAARKELCRPAAGLTSAVAVHASPPRVALGTGEFAAAGIRAWVQLADAVTGKPVGERWAVEPNTALMHLAFSPDGSKLAGVAQVVPRGACQVHVWDAATGRPVVRPRLVGEGAGAAVFSPDGRRLAVPVGPAVVLFDLSADARPARLAHPDPVKLCKFERGGEVLLTAAGSKVFVRRADTLEMVRPPLAMNYEVRSAGLSADGRVLVAGDAGNTVTGWRLGGGDRPPAVAAALTRLLTGEDEDPAAVERGWQAVKADRPAELTVPPADAAQWHNYRLNEAMRATEWQTASRHAEAIWTLMPDWTRALYNAGHFALRAGDRPGVRRNVAALRAVVRDRPAEGMQLELIENALTAPEWVRPADREAAQRLANWLAAVPTQDHRVMLAVALGHLRAGRLAAAEKAIVAAKASRWDGHQLRADVLLALVRRRQGRVEEATKLADAAAATIGEWERQGPYTNWEHVGFAAAMLAEAGTKPPSP